VAGGWADVFVLDEYIARLELALVTFLFPQLHTGAKCSHNSFPKVWRSTTEVRRKLGLRFGIEQTFSLKLRYQQINRNNVVTSG